MPQKKMITVDFDEVESMVSTPKPNRPAPEPKQEPKPESKSENKPVTQSNAVTQQRDNTVKPAVKPAPKAEAPAEQPLMDLPRKIANIARTNSIPRTNGCTYYLEDKHIQSIALAKALNNVDKQDIIRTAVDMFLQKYMKPTGMGLTDAGVEKVEEYLKGLQ